MNVEQNELREVSPSLVKNALRAAVFASIGAISGCVHGETAVATGASVSVSSDGNGNTQVICTPGTSSGPNAISGKARVVVNGKVIECP